MCGIFGYVGTEAAIGEAIFSGLRHLEYRGYDSWGIALSVEKSVHLSRDIGKLPSNAPKLPRARSGIGHTRWATTGKVTIANAHPHVVANGRLAIVHNGVVENFDDVQASVKNLNLNPLSQTDTELVGLLIAEHMEKAGVSLLDAVLHVAAEMEGLNAFVVLDSETNTLVATKTGSPLYIGKSADAWLVASDLGSLLPHTRQICRVGENESVVLEQGSATLLRGAERLAPEFVEYPASTESTGLGDFSSYTEKEIADQPNVLRACAARDLPTELAAFRNEMAQADHIWLTGCGTAFHAAAIGAELLNSVGFRAKAVYAHEWQHWCSNVRPSDALLAFSQSGETIDVLDAVREVLATTKLVMSFVNVRHSTLSLQSPYVQYLDAGREQSVLSTKAFLAKVVQLTALAHPEQSAEILQQCIKAVEDALSPASKAAIETVAEQLVAQEHLFLLGSGLFYTVAMEGALKIKEVSYLHAEAIPSGELKHGTLALITDGTPIVALVPDDYRAAQALTSVREVRARGASIIGISAELSPAFHFHLPVRGAGVPFSLGVTVVLQQLGLRLAQLRGHDPDKPRNLAKSVTVR